jgi:chromosome partitioning protein
MERRRPTDFQSEAAHVGLSFGGASRLEFSARLWMVGAATKGVALVSRILCVANQKGGVGKTTTAVNLADALARSGARTLLIDLDPQCNATSGLGVDPAERHPLVSTAPLQDSLRPTATEGLEVLPGSRNFRDIETLSKHTEDQAATLRQHLAGGLTAYDYVLIDCPPSLGQLTRTALASASEVLMPIQCEYFAMEGLAQMIDVIRQVMSVHPQRLQFGGILLTMYDHTLDLTHEVDNEVRDFFGEIVFQTVIPRDVAVAEAPSHGQSVLGYAPRSRGAWAYAELCMEVLERE